MIEEIPKLDWLMDDMDVSDAVLERVTELIDREIANSWAKLLQEEWGRLLAWSILDKCHIMSTTFTGNSAAAFLEGERSVGLKILKGHILPFGPHVWAQMMTEASDRFDRTLPVAESQITKESQDETD